MFRGDGDRAVVVTQSPMRVATRRDDRRRPASLAEHRTAK
jgi:hypothetical protein